jgi:hypothetical protein
MFSTPIFRSIFLGGALALFPISFATAAEPAQIVFQNGRSIPMSAVGIQGDRLLVKTAGDGFNAGQALQTTTVSHVYGTKPSGINVAVALLLTGKPGDALNLLEPILAEHRVSASFPGNFWLDSARAALVAHALEGDSAKVSEIGKQITDATPAQGADPFNALGRALLMPSSAKLEDRETALRDLTTDNLPADLCAYASFFRAEILKGAKRDAEALEAYLMVPCLFPSGGMILNAAAEFNAAGLISALPGERRPEAVALLKSSARESTGTILATEANKRLESME